jgi:hypothetical protein
VEIPEADYLQVGESLALDVRRDFTFIHPEILDARCRVDGAALLLDNPVNWERFRVVIIPGSRAIHVSNLRKLKDFYDRGGQVIGTTRLPDTAAEFGGDAEVRQLVTAMFGPAATRPQERARITASSAWAAGGYDAALAVDGSSETRWNAADRSTGPQWLEVDLGREETVSGAVVCEAFDRVRGYRIQTWDGAKWQDQAAGDRLGAHRRDTFSPVVTRKVRLLLEAVASDSASIAEWEILGGADDHNLLRPAAPSCHANRTGGRAWFLPSPSAAALRAVLDEALPDGDVVFEQALAVKGGNLSAIHKIKDGCDMIFLANSSDQAVDTWVRLRGKRTPELWNPHDGAIHPCEYSHIPGKEGVLTRVRLKLPPVHSVFLIDEREK